MCFLETKEGFECKLKKSVSHIKEDVEIRVESLKAQLDQLKDSMWIQLDDEQIKVLRFDFT